jgi:hypothetical protein
MSRQCSERHAWWGLSPLAVLVLTATSAFAQLAPAGATPIVGQVDWAAPGETGTALFQGLATEATLDGYLFAGEEQLVVTGAIESDGDVTGAVTTSEGLQVGNFAGTRSGDTLTGTYTVTGSSLPPEAPEAQTWEADAEGIPGAE